MMYSRYFSGQTSTQQPPKARVNLTDSDGTIDVPELVNNDNIVNTLPTEAVSPAYQIKIQNIFKMLLL